MTKEEASKLQEECQAIYDREGVKLPVVKKIMDETGWSLSKSYNWAHNNLRFRYRKSRKGR